MGEGLLSSVIPTEAGFPGQADLPRALSTGCVLLCYPPADPGAQFWPASVLHGWLPQRAQGKEVHQGSR